jgi:hypothetical protein
MGRPSIYTDELADAICQRLACGEPLAKICRDDAMPSYSCVRRWEQENAEFRALSARAKQDGTHYLADESLEIADAPLPSEDAQAEIAHRKIRIDTRMRLIGKWNRQDYGDKQLIGSDPENPLPPGFVIRDVDGQAS